MRAGWGCAGSSPRLNGPWLLRPALPSPQPTSGQRPGSGKAEALLSINTGGGGQAGVFSLAEQARNFHTAG